MDLKVLEKSGLPHQYFQKALPSNWSMEVYERHDRNARFQAYVSPVGVQYQSFNHVTEELSHSKDNIHKMISLPNEFYCPITKKELIIPFLRDDGHTYEKEIINKNGLIENKLLHALMNDFGKFRNERKIENNNRNYSFVSEVRRKSKEAIGLSSSSNQHESSSYTWNETNTSPRRMKRWAGEEETTVNQDIHRSSPPKKYMRNDNHIDNKKQPYVDRLSVKKGNDSYHHTYNEYDNKTRPRDERSMKLDDVREVSRAGNNMASFRQGNKCKDDVYRPMRADDRYSTIDHALKETRPYLANQDMRDGGGGGGALRTNVLSNRNMENKSKDDVWSPRMHQESKKESPYMRENNQRQDKRGISDRNYLPTSGSPRDLHIRPSYSDIREKLDESRQQSFYGKDPPPPPPPPRHSYESNSRDLNHTREFNNGFSGMRRNESDDNRPMKNFMSDRRLSGSPMMKTPPAELTPRASTAASALPLEYKEFVKVGTECSVQELKKRLLGPNHEHINHIEEECGVQLRLRGDVSPSNGEKGEPLYFLIKAKTDTAMQHARGLISDLIKRTLLLSKYKL